MAQTLKQRRQAQAKPNNSGRNLFFLLLFLLMALGLIYYVFPALTSGDWRWYSTEFKEQPREIAIVEQGQRTVVTSADPRFASLVSAFNQSIEQGYRMGAGGVSADTQERIERDGLYVEAIYAEPIKLHMRGGFFPTNKLTVVIGGKDLYLKSALFRHNPNSIDPLSIQMNTTEPLKSTLAQHGFHIAE